MSNEMTQRELYLKKKTFNERHTYDCLPFFKFQSNVFLTKLLCKMFGIKLSESVLDGPGVTQF